MVESPKRLEGNTVINHKDINNNKAVKECERVKEKPLLFHNNKY